MARICAAKVAKSAPLSFQAPAGSQYVLKESEDACYGFCHQEAPQAHVQEEAPQDAAPHPRAAS